MLNNFLLKRNDNSYQLNYSLVNSDNTIPNLTGATIVFNVGDNQKLLLSKNAMIDDAVSGKVSYTFTNADTLYDGLYRAEFVVTFPNGSVLSYPRTGSISINIQKNVDTSLSNVVLDAIAEKQGDFTAKLDSILQQAGNITMSTMNEWTWTATAGQLTYVMPAGANYDPIGKWFEVYVGGTAVSPDLIDRSVKNQFTLLVASNLIVAGITVIARWTEPIVPVTVGHHATHQIGGSDVIDVTQLLNYQEQIATPISNIDSSLAQITSNVKSFGAKGDGVTDDAVAIQNAINSIMTTEYTEAIPTQGAKANLLIPAGRYKIGSKITVPSYINIVGAGRHTTILDSYITNGDPVFNISHGDGNQQFYNTIKSLTINGRNQACKGISITNVSRWILEDVIIDETRNEGLYMYEAYLGEIRSCLIRACGDVTHYSVVYDGVDSNNGCHAVRMFGGEINGGGSSVNGVKLNYGNSVGFFGATIEGFSNGTGILNVNGIATMINGCYFETNMNHIETTSGYSPNYIGNIFGTPSTGSTGHIVVKNVYSGKIEGNFFSGTGFNHLVAKDGTSLLQYSSVKDNYVSGYPIIIDPILVSSALVSGTIIETFDASGHVITYGQRQMHDTFETLSAFKPTGGINNISGKTGINLTSGTGTPEGAVTAYPGALFLRTDGATDTSFYVKKSGVNSMFGWLPLQPMMAGTTASRPTVTTVGFCYYDITLYKPVYYAGSGVWKDATGTNV